MISLKDIEGWDVYNDCPDETDDGGYVEKSTLKINAVKCIKEIENGHFSVDEKSILIKWIKYFFNLTEEAKK